MFSHAISTCPSCFVRSVTWTICRSELACSSSTRSVASSDSFCISAIILLQPRISSVFSRTKWRRLTDILSLSSAALDCRLIRSRCAASSVSCRDSRSDISGNSSAASSTCVGRERRRERSIREAERRRNRGDAGGGRVGAREGCVGEGDGCRGGGRRWRRTDSRKY
eukprot:1849509-Prymnesium_polylepis.2